MRKTEWIKIKDKQPSVGEEVCVKRNELILSVAYKDGEHIIWVTLLGSFLARENDLWVPIGCYRE